jgi:hypothetical protein
MAQVLYDPPAHESLGGNQWCESRVREAIRAVVSEAERAYAPSGTWPLHPVDTGGEDDDWAGVSHGVYLGAAGMLWGLDRLLQADGAETSIDLVAAGAGLHDSYLARCHAPDEPMPGLWIGEAGVLLVAEILAPDRASADALLEVVHANARNEALEILWGAPGTMLAAREMHRRTGEERWAEAWRESAGAVLEEWRFDDEIGGRIWTNVLLGNPSRSLGAVHGFGEHPLPRGRVRPATGGGANGDRDGRDAHGAGNRDRRSRSRKLAHLGRAFCRRRGFSHAVVPRSPGDRCGARRPTARARARRAAPGRW